jgi:quercetin dioxygenase-like cupin family protein
METREHTVTHSPNGEGKTVWMVGTDLITLKATSASTGGAYALFDSLVLPGGGPPPHIHTREDESFYVLEGEFEFLAGDHWIQATPGSFVHVPKGSLHTLKNTGESIGRLLTLVVPAGLDRFFEEAGEPGTDISSPPGPPDVEKLLEISGHYGVEYPPPPAP